MIASFGELTFFVVLAALALPAVVLGLTGRNLKYYGLFATIAVLGLTLAG
ncbi:MAG: D-alanyl-lipoteichoic acid biosynthesis protein DltB, partial [Propionibacterium sp.]|nr:D-alanyl-lipoteichoic acid biosynthesis protein DltB [Propionibacterium sp.]